MCAQAHEMFSLQYEAGRHKWVTNVLNIVSKKKEKGSGIVWLCLCVELEARFNAEFKDWLISCYKQNWQSEIESDDKYRRVIKMHV